MLRKRKNPTPNFRMPPPYQPVTGEHAPLQTQGILPYCVLMQVAAEDTEANYVLCRGFDPRINKFIDYEAANANKPGIPVAKPYGLRETGRYSIGEMHAAALPIQCSCPSPVDALIRLGQNPGKAATSSGHPADLTEEVEVLTTDDGTYVNWMFIGGTGDGVVPAKLVGDLNAGSFIDAYLLIGTDRTTVSSTKITVYDIPQMITTGYKIPDDTIIRIKYDGLVGEYVLVTIAGCEVAQ